MEDADIRHRVVIAGQVTEARTGRALAGAQVLITSAPTAFVEPLVIAAKLLKITDAAMAEAQAKLANPRGHQCATIASGSDHSGFFAGPRFIHA